MKRLMKLFAGLVGLALVVGTSVIAGTGTSGHVAQLQEHHDYDHISRAIDPEQRRYFLQTTDPSALKVLRFWFEQWDQDMIDRGKGRFNQKWFPNGPDGIAGSREVDRIVTEKFTHLFENAVRGQLSWKIEDNPYDNLAFIILVDQFSRHIFRGKAEAYENDELALAAARLNIAKRFYRYYFTGYQRLFVVAPLAHNENLASQQQALRYLKQLNEHPEHRYEFLGILKSAMDHYQMILMFGRFPHRNQRYGRANTELESAYFNKQGNKGFVDGSKW